MDNKPISKLEQSMLDAIAIISTGSVKKSNMPVTIECTITEIEDAGQQLYKVNYKDNIFTASSSSGSYAVGDIVYVHIPEGDFSKTKIIIGAVESAENKVEEEIIDDYLEISDNLFKDETFSSEYNLQSYETTQISTTLSDNFKLLLSKQIESGKNNFVLSADIKTALPAEQQVNGNYGIILEIPVLCDPGTGKSYEDDHEAQEKIVYINIDRHTIEGNPYRLLDWSSQLIKQSLLKDYQLDFKKDFKLKIFVEDFPYSKSEKGEGDKDDIFIKNISFKTIEELTDEEKNGYYLTIVSDTGNFFLSNSASEKKLTPVLKIKGKTSKVDERYNCYQFEYDPSITPSSPYYSVIGGPRWKCLNEKTNVQVQSNGVETFDYIINVYSYIVKQEKVISNKKYKCILVNPIKQVTISSNPIVITNNLNTISCELKSATETNIFPSGVGSVELIAKVTWNEITSTDRFEVAQTRISADGQTELSTDAFEVIEIRQQDDYYEEKIKFPVSIVENSNEISCIFYRTQIINDKIAQERQQLGMAEIKIFTEEQLDWSATILNGDVLYKYDGDGNSPFVANYAYPYTIKSILPLKYKVYKPGGVELTDNEYNYCKTEWLVPINSLLIVEGETVGEYKRVNSPELTYKISDVYNPKKTDNYIILNVKFQDQELSQVANIKMVKEGESGTNGSKYTGVITYNGKSYEDLDNKNLCKLQLAYVNGLGWYKNKGGIAGNYLEPINDTLDFGIKVYCDGTNITDYSDRYSVAQSLFDAISLKNPAKENTLALKVVQGEPGKFSTNGVLTKDSISCTVIQAEITVNNTVDGKEVSTLFDGKGKEKIYCYYPVEVAYIGDKKSFKEGEVKIPYIADGFSKVLYASDSTNPQFDNANDFKVENILDISEDKKSYAEGYDFNQSGSENICIRSKNENTAKIAPVTIFNSGDSLNYVKVELTPNADRKKYVIGEKNRLEDEIKKLNAVFQKLNCYLHENEEYATFDEFYEKIEKKEEGNDQVQEILKLLKGDKVKLFLQKRMEVLTALEPLIDYVLSVKERIKTDDYKTTLQTLIHERELLQQISDKTAEEVSNYIIVGIPELNIKLDNSIIAEQTTKGKTLKNNTVKAFELYQKNFNSKLSSLKTSISKKTTDPKNFVNATKKISDFLQSISKIEVKDKEDKKVDFSALMEYGYFQDIVNYQKLYTSLTTRLAHPEDILSTEEKSDPEIYIEKIKTYYVDVYPLIANYNDIVILVEMLEKIFIISGKDYEKTLEYYKAILRKILKQKQEEIENKNNELDDYNNVLLWFDFAEIDITRPIIMLFNRYEMSNIVGQDGSKLCIDDRDEENPQYLLAPQVGAGIKNEAGRFTGLVMGLRNVEGSSTRDTQVGLFGQHDGQQTYFLNAEDGSAIMGKAGGGQIIIDPNTDNGLIYSSTFYKEFDNTGKPKNYSKSNESGKGMIIDLTTPEIRFGNGNFSVNADGHLIAAGGGRIGGQIIGDTELHSDVDKGAGRITIDSGNICENAYIQELNMGPKEPNDVKLGYSGKGETVKERFNKVEYKNKLQDTVEVSSDGKTITIKNGDEKKTLTGEDSISDPTTYISNHNIIGKIIYNDNGSTGKIYSHDHTDLDSTKLGFYLSSDGLSIGSKLKINDDGEIYAKYIEASGGKIGGQTINGNTLEGEALGGQIILDAGGAIKAENGESSQSIDRNGTATFNRIYCQDLFEFGKKEDGNYQSSDGSGTVSSFSFGGGTKGWGSISNSGFGFTGGGTTFGSTGAGGLTMNEDTTYVKKGTTSTGIGNQVGDIVAGKITAYFIDSTIITTNSLTIRPGHTLTVGKQGHGEDPSHLQIFGDIQLNGRGLQLKSLSELPSSALVLCTTTV